MADQLTAAGKALAVLGTFTRDRPSQSLSQIANRTGLALSTTHRVVTELAQWGALERTDEGDWHIGLRLWEVGSVCPRGQILRDVALPYMQDLYEVTHENIQLAVREGTEMVFVERIAGHRSVELRTMVGARHPLLGTAMGMVLLAYAPNEIREAVLAGPMDRHTPHTVTDPKTLRAMLAQTRRATCAVNDRQFQDHTVGVAAPVRLGEHGDVEAALGIVVAGQTGAAVRQLRHPVLAAARAISNVLGQRAGTR
ncbi:putative IclR family transcriptional regulator [Nostocoides australiense Ben110]|uniref:Putative IclR family transcriptional regulator n=1 Tax=Nostocoides australiense Ben110 TaxID=1193182 RepID=W6JWS8_9MICO|nr:IclR family transcriptional regulator [Tetrasphaera australiensis]CCH74023.1 putative IclR family transcriptional regulator [Tetrasphaera australiensis Ben110]